VSGAPTSHLTDEELLLDYYGEATAAERARVEVHLEECEDCRSLDAELRAVLSAVETTPITEPPGDFEREMWERIEPLLPVRAGGRTWSWMMPRLAAAAAVVLLVVAAYNAGRESNQETASEPPIERNDSLERLVRAEVGDHFERSQRVLVELAHADLATTPITGERARAADLARPGVCIDVRSSASTMSWRSACWRTSNACWWRWPTAPRRLAPTTWRGSSSASPTRISCSGCES
jgi:hypothetical protein